MSTKWIYVGIEEALLTLPEAERRVRKVALSAMRDAGIATPDAEAHADANVDATVGSGAQLTSGGNVIIDAASARTVTGYAAGTGISLGVPLGKAFLSAV